VVSALIYPRSHSCQLILRGHLKSDVYARQCNTLGGRCTAVGAAPSDGVHHVLYLSEDKELTARPASVVH
jgi:hypothetical protein